MPVVVSSLSVRLFCDSTDCSLPGSSVHGILQARILQWVAISFSGELPDPGMEPSSLLSPTLAGGFFSPEPPGSPARRPSFYFIPHSWILTGTPPPSKNIITMDFIDLKKRNEY